MTRQAYDYYFRCPCCKNIYNGEEHAPFELLCGDILCHSCLQKKVNFMITADSPLPQPELLHEICIFCPNKFHPSIFEFSFEVPKGEILSAVFNLVKPLPHLLEYLSDFPDESCPEPEFFKLRQEEDKGETLVEKIPNCEICEIQFDSSTHLPLLVGCEAENHVYCKDCIYQIIIHSMNFDKREMIMNCPLCGEKYQIKWGFPENVTKEQIMQFIDSKFIPDKKILKLIQ